MKLTRTAVIFPVFLLGAALAQTPAAVTVQANESPFDQLTKQDLATRAANLKAAAEANPTGLGTETLQKYPGHLTMLTVRTRSGGAEQHEHQADIFVVLDGQATAIVGGTIENGKESAPGEIRGSRVIGGVEHVMHPGDVIHIAPGIPHQTVLAPGTTFTYLVIKADQ